MDSFLSPLPPQPWAFGQVNGTGHEFPLVEQDSNQEVNGYPIIVMPLLHQEAHLTHQVSIWVDNNPLRNQKLLNKHSTTKCGIPLHGWLGITQHPTLKQYRLDLLLLLAHQNLMVRPYC